MIGDGWEPLLPDSRVGKIADLLRIAYPDLRDADFVTCIVPDQVERDRRSMKYAEHERGCPYQRGVNDDCECGPLEIPPQALFLIRQKHPRAGFDPVYKDKKQVTTEAIWLHNWQAVEKDRAHFVSTSTDPAYEIFQIAAKAHVKKQRGLLALI